MLVGIPKTWKHKSHYNIRAIRPRPKAQPYRQQEQITVQIPNIPTLAMNLMEGGILHSIAPQNV